MIIRTWRGAVRVQDAEEYLQHQAETGVREYRDTPGNLGVLVLRRPQEDLVEITTVSFWNSMDAIRAFAGDNPEQARFYAGDDNLLVEMDTQACHYEVVSSDPDPLLGG
ncbi:antibiotic biosynthesis monooxygenase [Nocardioides bruguierae]|uniref:ABM domain-containing protein n=1 Tax=Nocardioides bruguierae TaxID=2945102 RepID=A0A9X2IGH2_9ACTN|nr:antibiotic biosynthesis monooxygenase [Nocardioides bruguierae]MCM0622896.1 hypothetical protein [Nocardioides bruguierae]